VRLGGRLGSRRNTARRRRAGSWATAPFRGHRMSNTRSGGRCSVVGSLAWLQLWLQLAAFASVRGRSPLCEPARQGAYGTTVNRCERDHDGLAVWGSGVRVPSAPPHRAGRSSAGGAVLSGSRCPAAASSAVPQAPCPRRSRSQGPRRREVVLPPPPARQRKSLPRASGTAASCRSIRGLVSKGKVPRFA
jgi:hypothetical protein